MAISGRVAAVIGRCGYVRPAAQIPLRRLWIDYGEDLRAEMTRRQTRRFLTSIFERYSGPARELFRGENGDWASKTPSLSWTPNKEVARGFAQRNAALHQHGGVVLRAIVPPERIIPDLSDQEIGESEFLVNAQGLEVEIIERISAFDVPTANYYYGD